MTIKEAILKIINDYAGGCKLIDLVYHVTLMRMRGEIPGSDEIVDRDSILDLIQSMPELKFIGYHHHVDVSQPKIFIFTP